MILGVDLGTSSCKMVLFDEEGNVNLQKRKEYQVRKPEDGKAEHDPEDWENALRNGLRDIQKNEEFDNSEIQSIAVTGLGRGILFLDENKEPLRNCILSYIDSRTSEVEKEFSELEWGNSMSFKNLKWIEKNEQDVYQNTSFVVDARDYIGYLFTGELRRNNFGFKDARLEDTCEKYNISNDLFPDSSSFKEPVGNLKEELSQEFGFGEIPVFVGPWDAICSAVGSGLSKEGTSMIVAGSTTVFGLCTEAESSDSNKPYVTPDTSLYLGAENMNAAMDWVKDQYSDSLDNKEIDELMETAEAGNGPIFVPFLEGERENPDAKGMIADLESSQETPDLLRAALEGSMYHVRMKFENIGEKPIEELRISGGGSKSSLRNQIRANCLGMPVKTLRTDETSALGVSILASISLGIYSNLDEATENMVKTAKVYETNEEKFEKHQERYEKYKNFYEARRKV